MSRGQKPGPENTNWKHGGYSQWMSEEDAKWMDGKRAEYLTAYPHLSEPAMADILATYLRLLRQVERMWIHILGPEYPPEEVGPALARLTRIMRTCSLLGARMGVTYTSQRRRVAGKMSAEVKLPEELVAEMTKGDQA